MQQLRSSLVTRVLSLVAGVGLAAFLLLGSVEIWLDRERSMASVRAAAASATTISKQPIALALWNLDKELMASHAGSLVQVASIVGVRILDEDGSVLAKAQREGRLPPDSRKTVIPLTSPDGRSGIGQLEITESFAEVDARAQQRAVALIGYEFLKVGTVALGLLIVGHIYVMKRLRSLVAQIEGLPADVTDAQITLPGRTTGQRDEIALLAEAFNRFMRDRDAVRRLEIERNRADASSRAKTAFLSRMSHELRTPLNGIVGFAQVLAKDPVIAGDEARRRHVEMISRSGWHLTHLIDDVLDLSRIESGTAQIAIAPVDLRGSVEAAVSLVQADADERRVKIEWSVQADACFALADGLRLQQVLINLLSNGVKYNRDDGTLLISVTRTSGETVTITVADSGIGMSQEQLAMLYQPFNRLGRQSLGYPGTGIGLVISKALVEMMGGHIDVKSTAGAGSRFAITLPACEDASRESKRQSSKPGPGEAPQQRRIVYVEDDPVNVEVMRAVLAARPQYSLQVAHDLAGGLALVRETQPDLVLLDMQLPDGPGVDLLRAMRGDAKLYATPIVVVSADLLPESIAEALKAGANTYLSKPFEFDIVLTQIEALLA
jgi:signal transduction histidine kinase